MMNFKEYFVESTIENEINYISNKIVENNVDLEKFLHKFLEEDRTWGDIGRDAWNRASGGVKNFFNPSGPGIGGGIARGAQQLWQGVKQAGDAYNSPQMKIQKATGTLKNLIAQVKELSGTEDLVRNLEMMHKTLNDQLAKGTFQYQGSDKGKAGWQYNPAAAGGGTPTPGATPAGA